MRTFCQVTTMIALASSFENFYKAERQRSHSPRARRVTSTKEETLLRRSILSLAVLIGFFSLPALAADSTPAWNEIMAKKKLTACVVPSYQP